jgi:NitT/TauT family transport system substrate-binding protein
LKDDCSIGEKFRIKNEEGHLLKAKWILFILILSLLISSCAWVDRTRGRETQDVRLILPFRPDVQFAPFYVAKERGYFSDEGLNVSFEHLPENDALTIVGNGEAPFAVVSGEQVLLARAQQIPIVYVMAWWQDYPVAVAYPAESNIKSVEDLAGKKIGIPGLYGASYIGLRALLSATGISEDDLILDSIGYNQVEAMLAGQEDAIVVYVNNEPIQLEAQNFSVKLFKVADYVHLTSNGLITSEDVRANNPDLVRSMVAATLKGIQDTMDDPEAAFEISKEFVEGLDQADQAVMLQVLEESINFWKADQLGKSSPEAWENMDNILYEMGLLESKLDLKEAFTNEFLPED